MRRSLLSLLVVGLGVVCLTAGGCPLFDASGLGDLGSDGVAGDNNIAPVISDPSVEAVLVEGEPCSITVSCEATDEDGTIQVVEADLSSIGGDTRQALAAQDDGTWSWTGVVTPPTVGTHGVIFSAVDNGGAEASTVYYEVEVEPVGGPDVGDGAGDGDGDGNDQNDPPVFTHAAIDKELVDIDSQDITITCDVSDPDGTVSWVAVSLTELYGNHGLPMDKVSEGHWTLTYPVAPWTTGTKTIHFTAYDDDGAVATYSLSVQVNRHPITILRDVATGYQHAVALRDDGTMLVWGFDESSQNVPQAGKFLKVSGGEGYSLAIREDGTLVAWGHDDYGETVVPAGTFKEVAAGVDHSVAIRTDGSLIAWGRDHLNWMSVPPGNGFVTIDNLFGTCIALRDNGTLAVWGPQPQPLLGVPMPTVVTDAPSGSDFVEVAVGGYHALARKADGTVVAWGNNDEGECDVPPGTYKAIDAGYLFSAAVRTDGSVVAWGANQYGVVSEVPAGNDFVDIWCSMNHGVAKRADGSLVYWGTDDLAPIPDELK